MYNKKRNDYSALVELDLGWIDVTEYDFNVAADGVEPAVERKLRNMSDEELAQLVRDRITIFDDSLIIRSSHRRRD